MSRVGGSERLLVLIRYGGHTFTRLWVAAPLSLEERHVRYFGGSRQEFAVIAMPLDRMDVVLANSSNSPVYASDPLRPMRKPQCRPSPVNLVSAGPASVYCSSYVSAGGRMYDEKPAELSWQR